MRSQRCKFTANMVVKEEMLVRDNACVVKEEGVDSLV